MNNEPIHQLISDMGNFIKTIEKYTNGLSTTKIKELVDACKAHPQLIDTISLKNKMIKIKNNYIKHIDVAKNEIDKIEFN